MPILPENPTLADYQAYVAAFEVEHGFEEQNILEKCLLLGEEMGELFKAVRQREGIKIDTPGGEVALELADILIYLCAIANRCNVDLEAAFRMKETINQKRKWV